MAGAVRASAGTVDDKLAGAALRVSVEVGAIGEGYYFFREKAVMGRGAAAGAV